jgi:hypothetical protein
MDRVQVQGRDESGSCGIRHSDGEIRELSFNELANVAGAMSGHIEWVYTPQKRADGTQTP